MDDIVWKVIPLITGGVGYLGGIATEPIKKLITDYLRVKELKAGLIGEIANAYEQYCFALQAGDRAMLNSIKKSIRVDCYAAAKASPFLLHRIAAYFYLANALDFAISIKELKEPYDLESLLPEIALQVKFIESWVKEQSKKDVKTFNHALGRGARARLQRNLHRPGDGISTAINA